MTISGGTIVKNSMKPEWGLGKVVAVAGGTAHVVFKNVGGDRAKRIQLKVLEVADVQHDPLLDHLPPLKKGTGKYEGHFMLPAKRLTLKETVETFLRTYPEGFYDRRYIGDRQSGERAYKLMAHEKWNDQFGQGRFRELLEADRKAELVESTLSILTKVNLLSSFESIALRDALANEMAAQRFFKTLLPFLEARQLNGEIAENYFDAVRDLPQKEGGARVSTWPVATIIPFLAMPEKHMFLKPEVTKRAQETLGFNLNYDATPNWLTYKSLLEMGQVYMEQLDHLKPRDFIDIQSFIYVACGGGSYQ